MATKYPSTSAESPSDAMDKTPEQRNVETRLRDLAAERGATVSDRGNGHFQIKGSLLVNYYPFAKRATAYVGGTTGGRHFATPQEAVAMAFKAPPAAQGSKKDERGNGGRYGRWKRRMWKSGYRHCFWCQAVMDRNIGSPTQMTVDHKIPLFRGGLDNPNNWVPACRKCNDERGHNMPELKTQHLDTGDKT